MSWWERLENFAEKMLEKYRNITDIEIFDATYNKKNNRYIVKIGVYPYGVFIEEGTLKELEKVIAHINELVAIPKYNCPFCNNLFSDLDIESNIYTCKKCKAKIYKSDIISSYNIHENVIFKEIIEEIENKYGEKQAEFIKKLIIEHNYELKDVFENVRFLTIDDFPAYAFKGEDIALKPLENIKEKNPIKWKLVLENWELTYKDDDEGEIWEKEDKRIVLLEDEIFVECELIIDIPDFDEKTGEDFFDEYFYEFGEGTDILINQEWINGIAYTKEEFLKLLEKYNNNIEKTIKHINSEFKSRQMKIAKKHNYEINTN